MLDIRVNTENMTAEVRSSGKSSNVCVEAVLMVKLIIREIAKRDDLLARGVLKVMHDDICERTVEEIVAELNEGMTEARGENGRLS